MQQAIESLFVDQAADAATVRLNAAIDQFKKFLACASNGVVALKPSGAKFMLERLNFPHQRAVDDSRVFTHQHALRRGD